MNCLPKTQFLANTNSGSIRNDSCPIAVSKNKIWKSFV